MLRSSSSLIKCSFSRISLFSRNFQTSGRRLLDQQSSDKNKNPPEQSQPAVKKDDNKTPMPSSKNLQDNQQQSSADNLRPPTLRYKVSELDKMILVWSGQFKSKSEIPDIIDSNTMHKGRSWARIRTNISFCVLAAVLSVIAVYKAKQDALDPSNMIIEKNIEMHRKNKEEPNKLNAQT